MFIYLVVVEKTAYELVMALYESETAANRFAGIVRNENDYDSVRVDRRYLELSLPKKPVHQSCAGNCSNCSKKGA